MEQNAYRDKKVVGVFVHFRAPLRKWLVTQWCRISANRQSIATLAARRPSKQHQSLLLPKLISMQVSDKQRFGKTPRSKRRHTDISETTTTNDTNSNTNIVLTHCFEYSCCIRYGSKGDQSRIHLR
jgi:hypothetical protein